METVFFIKIFVCIAILICGIVLLVLALHNLCNKYEGRLVQKRRRVSRFPTKYEYYQDKEKVCVEEDDVSKGSDSTKAKYYSGITLIVGSVFYFLYLLVKFLMS